MQSMATGAASQRRTSIVALVLIGAGLITLGLAAMFLIPKLQSGVGSAKEISAVPQVVNYAAPEVNLKDLQGNLVSLSDSLGKVVLVNHWATWCPPCKAEMPILQEYHVAHQDKDFSVIAIDEGEPVGTVSKFVGDYGLSFPVWLDPEQVSLDIFGYDGLPSSYVLDRGGMVRLVWIGAISREMLEEHVTPLIEQ